MATYAPPPTYPHRDLGIALLIVGIIALVGGIAAAAYCSVSFLGLCLDYPYAGVGALSAVAGIALLILGVVLMVLRATPPAPVVQPVYFAPPAPAGGVVYYPVPATLPPSPPRPHRGHRSARRAPRPPRLLGWWLRLISPGRSPGNARRAER